MYALCLYALSFLVVERQSNTNPKSSLGLSHHAFIAQGLERWSSKPEVGSSILPEGSFTVNLFYIEFFSE